MDKKELTARIDALVLGDVSPDEHLALQAILKADPAARALFRERVDLETGLRIWAAESPPPSVTLDRASSTAYRSGWSSGSRRTFVALAVAASIVLIVAGVRFWNPDGESDPIAVPPPTIPKDELDPKTTFVATLRSGASSVWGSQPTSSGSRYSTGRFVLTQGSVELSFDSGTDVVLHGPCELVVLSHDSARLVAGSVFVNVTELSNGFLLEPPDARVLDEGTEYAVSVDADATEVHVFDGSVIWVPADQTSAEEQRIGAGEAARYLRNRPTEPVRIPFGQRQFVRRVEAEVRQQAGEALSAYDGFENLAGQLRRDRSGFGWSGGWQPGGRGHGRIGNVVDAPNDVAFGVGRAGRRLLALSRGEVVRRQLTTPLQIEPGKVYYVSLIASRLGREPDLDQSLHVSLEPFAAPPWHRRMRTISFGASTELFPYINSQNVVRETALSLVGGDTYLFVAKLAVGENGVSPYLRVFRTDEPVAEAEPSVWTVVGASAPLTFEADSLRLAVGRNATWQIDELRVGTTWQSVIVAPQTE